jgi:hypothetical protein
MCLLPSFFTFCLFGKTLFPTISKITRKFRGKNLTIYNKLINQCSCIFIVAILDSFLSSLERISQSHEWHLSFNFVQTLTPKGRRSFFSKKMLKSAISNLVSKNGIFFYFFGILTVGSSTRLLGEHVQKNSKKLTVRIVRL